MVEKGPFPYGLTIARMVAIETVAVMMARRSVRAKSMYRPTINCALKGLRNDQVAMNLETVSGRNQSRAMNMLKDGTPPKR
jgi:hypothetical protein